MTNKEEKQLEIRETVTALDSKYVNFYLPEAISYFQQGVYNEIVALLSTPKGGIHVNFCSGPFFIEAALRSVRDDIAIAGIEYNQEMLRTAAAGILPAFKIPFRPHREDPFRFSNFLQTNFGYPIFYRQYDTNFGTSERFMEAGGPIEMILGDAAEEYTIKAILGDRKMDSCSLSFAGTSGSVVTEGTGDFSQRELYTMLP